MTPDSAGTTPAGRGRPLPLLAAAAALHLVLAVALQLAGRAGALPALAGPAGFSPALAHDASIFQFQGEYLVNALRSGGLAAWAAIYAAPHTKLISLCYYLFSSRLGTGVLGVEPLNLLYYLATLTLVYQLAALLSGRRAGLLAAGAVALWPSFLLLGFQLLRDPPFVVALLGLCRVCLGWLAGAPPPRRDGPGEEGPRRRDGLGDALRGLRDGLLGGLAVLALWIMRWDMQEVIAAAATLGALAVLLQRLRRRPLGRGALLGAALLLCLTAAAPRLCEATTRIGFFPRLVPGLAVAPLGPVVPTRCEPRRPGTCVRDLAERVAWRAEYLREKFLKKYSAAGSNVDAEVRLGGARDLGRYLPRALGIGLLAPFPSSWLKSGAHVGRAGRLLAGGEMLVFYAVELLALWHLVRRPSVPALYLMAVVLIGCAALGAVVLNVGTLFRLRSGFFALLLVLAAGPASAACSRTRSGRSWARR